MKADGTERSVRTKLYLAQQSDRLDLSSHHLTRLPPEATQLTHVREMDLDDNELTDLPPEIGQLTNLQALGLSGNELTNLPPEITQLTNLRSLNLSGNKLTNLPPEITQLTNLESLRLSGNKLTNLPPEITQLTNLRSLNLSGNKLTNLPPEITQLTNLEGLDLRNNKLTSLPSELAALLVSGLTIKLSRNPLAEPLPEIVARGPEALAAYLRSLEDAVPQYEAKILLVGEGNVGKTSLVAALQGNRFVEGRPTTHGIEIHALALPHPEKDVTMTVRAWDFGGQEVYRITHQFFFSRRALYLVVWHAREGQEQNEVEGWLRRIRLRVGNNARALVVATHCDTREPELDYPRLERSSPAILAGEHAVDNRTGNGIPELRTAIAAEAARLPQMGQRLSPRWVAARDEVLAHAEAEPQIALEAFAAVCKRHQLTGPEIIPLAELLHDLGHIVYYGDDEGLRDIVVLNPEWLTKAIGYVLEDSATRKAHGVLDHTRLRQIWQERPDGPAYSPRYHAYFLRLMEKFDVSYRLEYDEHKSLVAQLVPHQRPNLPWDSHTPVPAGTRTLALVCQLSEPAPGLVAWLTVRHHRASTGRHWRSGVFLRHPIDAYASEALLELRDDRQLAVEVRAPSPDLFFNVLRDSVEDLITHRWPGLSYQLLVPCPTRNRDGTACPGQFKLKGLLRLRERGRTSLVCQECIDDHDVATLLTGFAAPAAPLQPQLEQLHSQLSDVASGMDRLERYAAKTAESMRRVLKATSTEVTDCPRLFTLTQEQVTGLRRLRFYQAHYRLTLWCEHPSQWHVWPDASYQFDPPKDWLARIGPYAALVTKTLQLVVPIAGAVAGVALTETQLKDAKQELELMMTLVNTLPEKLPVDWLELESRKPGGLLNASEGAGLRALRVLLFDLDHTRAFGGLRRVQAPSGDFLWVCARHYPDYDPGLPTIPGS